MEALTPRPAPQARQPSAAPGIPTWQGLGSLDWELSRRYEHSSKANLLLKSRKKRLLRINFSLQKLYGRVPKLSCRDASIFSDRKAQALVQNASSVWVVR